MKLLSAAVVLLLCLVATTSAQTGEVFVATRQVKMQTATAFFKFPVEAQRGERWEIVKKDKKKVALTFGPGDERRVMMQQIGKVFKYELSAAEFAAGFVAESDWPNARARLAAELQGRFMDLSVAECERIINGEYWIGMKREHAAEVAGNRVLAREITETADGAAEIWKVAVFSLGTTAATTAKDHAIEGALATPSRPRESLDPKLARDMEQAVRIVLTFKGETLTSITRRK